MPWQGGIFALTKVLSVEYGRYGIRVNVAPGGTEVQIESPRLAIRPGVAEALDGRRRAYREEMSQDIRHQQAEAFWKARGAGGDDCFCSDDACYHWS
jgi:NAD(P)-dependent dehydrogenase (short-subunit alcohol dehydrogenase family)